MKLGQLKAAQYPLVLLIESELPIRIAFQLNSIIDKIDTSLARLEEFRIKLIEKYGEKAENGDITVANNKKELFNQEYIELLDSEVDIEPVAIPISVFEENNIKMSVKNVNALVKAGFIVMD